MPVLFIIAILLILLGIGPVLKIIGVFLSLMIGLPVLVVAIIGLLIYLSNR